MDSNHGIIICLFGTILMIVKPIVMYIYMLITKRRVSYSPMITFLCASIFVLIVFTVIVYTYYFPLADWNLTGVNLLIKYNVFTGFEYFHTALGVIILLLGFRALFSLQAFPLFGPMITILESMLKITSAFMAFHFLLIFIFALAYDLFTNSNYVNNTNLMDVICILFQASTAVYDLTTGAYGYDGDVLMIFYVIITNIMLLSLLVALLTDVYSKMSNQSLPLYLREVLSNFELHRPHKEYQFIVSSFLGIDTILTLFVLPFMLFLSKNTRRKINSVILYLEYSIGFFIILAFYVAFVTIVAPFCYLKILSNKFLLLFNGIDSVKQRLVDLFIFLFFGWIFVAGYWASDIFFFVAHSYKCLPSRRFEQRESELITKTDYKKVLKEIINNQENKIGLNKLLLSISGE